MGRAEDICSIGLMVSAHGGMWRGEVRAIDGGVPEARLCCIGEIPILPPSIALRWSIVPGFGSILVDSYINSLPRRHRLSYTATPEHSPYPIPLVVS